MFPKDRLLVSSVNGGGLLLVEDGRVDWLSCVDTAGVLDTGDRVLLVLQSGESNELREIDAAGDWRRIVVASGVQDLHDVVLHDGAVHVASTEHNAVLRLSPSLSAIERRWQFPGERDACHLNALCSHRGRLLASRFGRFDTHRGYKGLTRGAGEVFAVEDGEVVVAGLSQPHSIASHDGDLWVCDSEAHALRRYRDGAVVAEVVLDGYVRGLAFGPGAVFVGLSRSRNDPGGALAQAALVALDPVTLAERARLPLPVDEVYDIVPARLPNEALRRGAIADLRHEVRVVAHARNVAAVDAHAARGDVASLSGALHRANLASIAAARASDALRGARGAALAESADLRLQLDDARAIGEASHAAALASLPPPDPAARPVPALAFDAVDAPVVSILVTAHGRFAETARCLRAIAAAGATVPFEVILVEDASGEPAMARFRHVPGLRYIENAANLGYLRSVNAAAAHARGQWLHLLNNDTCVRPGWLDALLETPRLFDRFGAAGSMLVYPDGRLQEAGGIVWSDGSGMNEGRDGNPVSPAYATVREVDYVSAASLFVARDTWRQLGGFDDRYAPAYYEDTDFAFRLREAGLRVFVQPRSVVEHVEGLSHGTDTADGGKAGQVHNHGVFAQRWHDPLQRDQCPPGALHRLARERSQRQRMVLVVDRYAPRTDRDAGSRAIWSLLRTLSTRGLAVKFWSWTGDEPAGYADSLRRHGVEFLCTADVGMDLSGWLAANGALVDTIIVSRPEVARHLLPQVRATCRARVVYFGHDLHYLRMARQATVEGDAALRPHAAAMRTVEREIWRDSDVVLYPSDAETLRVSRWLHRNAPAAVARTVPLYGLEGAPPAVDAAAVPARRDVVFVGGFAHAPNADAAAWFVREAWPRVRAAVPGARLVLVGAEPPEAIATLAADDIVVTGRIDEAALLDLYAGARAAIVPLRYGAGLKGKVVEALWRGVPCVTTPVGAEGMSDALPDALDVAADAAGLADGVAALFGDDARWHARSAAGQAFAARTFSADALWALLSSVMDTAPYADVAARQADIAARQAR